MSCLAYSPPCHSAEVCSFSWDSVLREGIGISQAGNPGRWKPQSSLNITTGPFPSLTSTSKYVYTKAKCCILRVPGDSLPITLILVSFHATTHRLEECGHRQMVLALEDLVTCADSIAVEQVFPDFIVQISRLLCAGLSSIHLIPPLTNRAALKSS